MSFRLAGVLFISLCLAGCAAESSPTRITAKVADIYSGVLHLNPCAKNAQDVALVDEKGNGNTSACPLGDVEIVVVKGDKTIYIAPEKVKVERTGDGFPAAISAVIQ
jgi:hypothetical protein